MIRRFAKFTSLNFLVSTTGNAWAQDLTISQFMANALYTYAGIEDTNLRRRATMMYQYQWPISKIKIHSTGILIDASFLVLNYKNKIF